MKPKKQTDCSYSELIDKLRLIYTRVTNPIVERVEFFTMRQKSSQSIADFINILRNKAATCQFPDNFYEQALITAFIGGLKDKNIRYHLMLKNLISLDTTIHFAKTLEAIFN